MFRTNTTATRMHKTVLLTEVSTRVYRIVNIYERKKNIQYSKKSEYLDMTQISQCINYISVTYKGFLLMKAALLMTIDLYVNVQQIVLIILL